MASAKRVLWAPAAERDLLDIWAYYVRVASPDIADKLLRDIDRISQMIAEHPLLSRDRGELMPGLRSVLARPPVIFFLVKNDHIEIARVLHGRRNFPAIFAREEE
jgi:toxin ParE1/3/4